MGNLHVGSTLETKNRKAVKLCDVNCSSCESQFNFFSSSWILVSSVLAYNFRNGELGFCLSCQVRNFSITLGVDCGRCLYQRRERWVDQIVVILIVVS